LKDIAMQIAAANPRYIRPEEVPSGDLQKEREIYRQQALETGKPEKVIEKIVDGKIDRFYSEVCLLEQAFIKNPERKVADILTEAMARLGENIQVKRFSRYQLGEGGPQE
jgi:elongation factor Ts